MGTNNFNYFTTTYKYYTLGAINQIAGMDVEKYIQILCKTSFLKKKMYFVKLKYPLPITIKY